MGWNQIIFGVAIVVSVFVLAIFYGCRQIFLLRRLSPSPDAENSFHRRLAYRRLVGSGSMMALACLLAGALVYLENPAQDLADLQDARELAGQETVLRGKEADFVRTYSLYWSAILLVLLVIVGLAGADLWAIHRFGRAQFKRLREDRRAMIERETARIREERDGRDDILRN